MNSSLRSRQRWRQPRSHIRPDVRPNTARQANHSHAPHAGLSARRVVAGIIWGLIISTGCTTHHRPLVVTQPPDISIETGRNRPPIIPRRYDTFWDAINNADIPSAQQLAGGRDERRFASALAFMLGGQDDSAEHAIASLLHSHDTVVRDAARITYGAILSARSEWGRLAAFSDSLSTLNSSTPDSLVTSQYRIPADAAGVQAWAAAFRTVAPTRHFADSSTTLPFVRTLTGTPLIEIRVNGVIKHFWIDTGSSITILSSTAAAECGVIPIQPDTLELQTSVGRLPARPTVVHALDVGGLHTSNAPAMIVDASLLTLRTNRRIPLTTPTVRIDGIIGFDVIRHIDLTIDDARGRITIRKPTVRAVRPGTPRNLFWFGVPIVTLTSPLGLVVHLSLDTGAEETYGTGTLVTKSGVRAISAERRTLQGFGGSTTERGVVIPRIRLFLGHTPLLFERVFLYNAQYPTIFELDGTLGADIGRGNVLRIDMTNGRLELTSH